MLAKMPFGSIYHIFVLAGSLNLIIAIIVVATV